MTEAAQGMQGSGWGALHWEPLGQRLVVLQLHDHQNSAAVGSVPLLVLDMWEHAYYLQYRDVKTSWVTAFWRLVHWQGVAQRFATLRTLTLPA
jgi:Fe-Mn family superoxide dismutase